MRHMRCLSVILVLGHSRPSQIEGVENGYVQPVVDDVAMMSWMMISSSSADSRQSTTQRFLLRLQQTTMIRLPP